jgi:DNA repair ATPase RecN
VSLLYKIDIIHIDLAREHDDLATDHHQLNSAEDKIDHLHGVKHNNNKTINDLHAKVNSLKAQLKEQDQSHPPCKMPHYGKHMSPFHPASCLASSMMKDHDSTLAA